MRIHSSRRIDRRTAEQLLGAPSAGTDTGHPQLAALLAAAAAPGRPEELSSEEATLSAFRAASHAAIPRQRGLATIKSVAMKALTVKMFAILATTTTVGGVALAASTGALPNPLARPAPGVSSGLSAADPTASGTGATSTSGSRASTSTLPSSAADGRGPSRLPSPALLGLCGAYRLGEKTEHDKILDNPAFKELITAAGGRDKVEAYCQALLTSRFTGDSRRDPTRDGSRGHDDGRVTPRPSLAPAR